MPKIKIKLVHTDTLSCEPIARRMPNGEILLVCQCGDVYEPAPGNRVYCFHSADNGKTWSTPHLIVPDNGDAVYQTELNCIDGVAYCYLTRHNGQFFNWRTSVAVSYDYGYTWEEREPLPGVETFTFVRGLLTLKSGRLLLPYQRYPISKSENERVMREFGGVVRENGKLHQIGSTNVECPTVDTGVLISDDRGVSWKKYSCPAFAQQGDSGYDWVWSEPTIAELSDGRVAMLIRVTKDVLWYSESKDKGETWSEFVPTDIPNPSCKVKLLNLPDGRIALIHDPSKTKRNPFSIWITDDDMKTWKINDVISNFPLKFDYPDAFYEDGHIYITVELHRRDILFIDYDIMCEE